MVLPHPTSTIKVAAWAAFDTAAPSLVVTIAEVHANVDIWTRPASSAPEILASLKLSLMAELGNNSTRPNFPRLIVALLFAAVATKLSEKTVAPEIAA